MSRKKMDEKFGAVEATKLTDEATPANPKNGAYGGQLDIVAGGKFKE
jgi:hypothetical protein